MIDNTKRNKESMGQKENTFETISIRDKLLLN
jgi:hypothetical protein